ncbi:hypothetical protein CEUSTIGMA_g4780.t1 [Chlamydomonas eustigma]|uniref:Uncharacterized protein n=1 Tax=Chlamydomonas eustigma TaxID=1157962 RepID=A0A250X2L1_9CHLO|nr:hypothetical protein CEUSTIGMA_g4780.t1 [Chlamydomonas eustigma]|eukprot:GAX77334.1 hypothetical protein CEUSTIGMA_g4780.t1 [Chlamydomonas eustigma]
MSLICLFPYSCMRIRILNLLSSLLLCSAVAGKAVNKEGVTCFVIKTSWVYGSDNNGDGYLMKQIQALRNQTSSRWVARLAVLDTKPFGSLRKMLKKLDDDRVAVGAEWISGQFRALEGQGWAPGYLEKLYNITDEAIRTCPPWTNMVVVSGGSDLHDADFVTEVEKAAAEGVDIFSTGFYSRFQRPTASPCERFAWKEGVPLCKENMLVACQMDLAATAYRWKKLLQEKRYFGRLGVGDSQDGILTKMLIEDGWKVKKMNDRCLVNTFNNPQQCALEGNAWDDAFPWRAESYGGACVPFDEIRHKLSVKGQHLQMVSVNLTYDPKSNVLGVGHDAPPALQCMRLRDSSKWLGPSTFGRLCAADIDYAELPESLPAHVLDTRMQVLENEQAVGSASEQAVVMA